MKRTILSVLAAGALVAGCGSSKSTSAPASAGGASTAAKAATVTTTGAATTAAKATTATTTAAATTVAGNTTATTAGKAASGAVEVTLKEWSIAVGGTIAAGAGTLNVKNTGQNPHELKIIKGDSYDALPKSNGAVDESKLDASAIVAKQDRIGGGASATLSVNLPAGKYVFVCNLGNGANSHAAKGQHLDVTVG